MEGIENEGLRWQSEALCIGSEDPDLFFPDRSDLPTEALAVCRGCPVQLACRAHALAQPERFGVWGGLTEADREQLLRASGTRRPVQRPSAWVRTPRRRRVGA